MVFFWLSSNKLQCQIYIKIIKKKKGRGRFITISQPAEIYSRLSMFFCSFHGALFLENAHADPDKNPKGAKQCNDQVQTNVICKSFSHLLMYNSWSCWCNTCYNYCCLLLLLLLLWRHISTAITIPAWGRRSVSAWVRWSIPGRRRRSISWWGLCRLGLLTVIWRWTLGLCHYLFVY